MKKTLSYLLKYWPVALLAIACLICECVCDLLQPTLMASMINQGVEAGNAQMVWYFALRMLGITALGMCFAIARALLSSNASQRFGRDVRLALYKQIQGLSLLSVDQFERASLVTRLTNDVTQVQNFVNGTMRFFLRAPILCVGSIFMAYRLSHTMAAALAMVVPVSALIIMLSVKIGYPYFYKVQLLLDKLNATVREYLSGIRVVKAFNRFDYEEQRFEDSNGKLTDASSTAMRVTAFFGPAISLVVNLGIAAVIMLGGWAGEEKGNVIAFVNYMNQIMFSLSMFSMIFNQLVRALVSGRRMEEVLAAETGMDMGGTRELDSLRQGIRFEDVGFRYRDTQTPALEQICFEARKGETIGIIGSTGTGKSTLINLIARLYDVSEGRILMDSVDIRDLDIHSLRERVAIVPQQNLLFTGPIADNLRWGKLDATEAELWTALETAQAADFVRGFPEGLNTELSQAGANLSGGQKQRLSIARALVKAPDVLILDDCTSALDVTTEAKIRQALRAFSKEIICFVISQRITSILSADRILVLDQGRIAAQGTHAELMQISDIYKDIYHSQIGKGALWVG